MISGFTQKMWRAILLVSMLLTAAGCGSVPSGPAISTAGPEIGSVRVNGINIAYERHGPMDRETVLLIAANIPGAELIIIPGMGHDLPAQLIPDIADAITSAAQRAVHTKK